MPISVIQRFFTILSVVCLAALPLVAQAQDNTESVAKSWQNPDEVVTAIEDYFAGLETAKARFTQTQDTGETASGEFFLSRPGKMRFAYEEPNESFIVADGTFIYFWDDELGQVSQTTISSTLANVLLQETISLNDIDNADPGALMVREVRQVGEQIYLALELANDPGQGQLTVVFDTEPLQLNRWLVRDAQGFETLVEMTEWREGIPLDSDLFFFSRPGFGGVDR